MEQRNRPNWDFFCKRFSTNFVSVKSFVTVAMTAGLLILLSGVWSPPEPIVTLYCSAFSSVMTYYFMKAKEE